ncbi:MAG: hypothetical protein COV10_00410 [Candidatus Vogelbacteria bacterium CG10_big_fil_rev_8_21_14_0_10_51_16]|uniref:DUF5672 domain-containing protein n=1 Tax=Candidatus Vogelbacteria bacterium CG10_big_fil_rev_8_21_14_0_10_51_16 TaxID=1975045 RepID=A0A2H0RFU0_9BACT|nr:MAG: hypothetical protein COV10_00410 [Candidatus Vogelbacteria bacterium CG10_big_fil_rev_8_21_14_0_10_51_16]
MLQLKNVTLLGLDCVELNRLKIARDICVKDIEFGAVKLLTSIESDDKDVVKIDKVGSIEAYSEFLIKKLNEHVETEFVLIFQYDGFVLSAANWRDEFLSYDYIGAPWIGYYKENAEQNIGNGGFSLRSKKLLEILAHDETIKVGRSEDGLICRQYRDYLEKKAIKYAPQEIAGTFAVPDIMKQNDVACTDQQYRTYLKKQGIEIDSLEDELAYQIPEAYEKGDLRWTNQFGFH